MLLRGGQKRYDGNKHKHRKSSAGHGDRPKNPRKSKTEGGSLSVVMSLYILHEADVSKFVESADEIIQRNKDSRKSKLQLIRKARGLTQQQLSEASGVSLRMIQLYEQKQYELAKAQAGIVLDLAKVLGCDAADLIQG